MPEHEKITVTSGAQGRTAAPVPEGTRAVEGASNIVGAGGSGAHNPITVTAGTPPATEGRVLTQDPRPTWLPDRFKTAQDLLKSQEEGQATITRLSQELAELKKGNGFASPAANASPAATTNAQSTDGQAASNTSLQPDAKSKISLSQLSAEFAANGGKITPESMAKLKAVGITEEDVGQYIAGQQAIANRIFTDLEAVAGGKANYDRVMQHFRGTNAGLEFNKAIATGNTTAATMMLRGMIGDFQREVGRNPRLFVSGTEATRAAAEEPFVSMAELQAAQRDPRYKNDPAYRRSVERRGFAMAEAQRNNRRR